MRHVRSPLPVTLALLLACPLGALADMIDGKATLQAPDGFVWYGPATGPGHDIGDVRARFPPGCAYVPDQPGNVWDGEKWPLGDPPVGTWVLGSEDGPLAGGFYVWYDDGTIAGRWVRPVSTARAWAARESAAPPPSPR